MYEVVRLKFQWNCGLYRRDFLEKFKENNQLFENINKGKPPGMFSLACNLLKMDAYVNDFQKFF